MAENTRNPKWGRDELILALELYCKQQGAIPGVKHPDVIKLSEILNKLPTHSINQRRENYRNANSIIMKLGNFRAIDPSQTTKGLSAGSKGDREVWDEYAHRREELHRIASVIKEITESGEADALMQLGQEEGEMFALEGQVLARTHFLRERNIALVKKKKELGLLKHGYLFCDACGFSFEKTYGSRGKDFIECHHQKPLSELKAGEKTTLSDLALLCSNCHKMVHAQKPWLTIEELRAMLKPSTIC